MSENKAQSSRQIPESAEKKEKSIEILRIGNSAVNINSLDDAEVSRQERLIRKQLQEQRKVRIIIASGKDARERCPVPVAVNGREYLIVRDTPVDVPTGVLNVLDLAVEQIPEVVEEHGQSRTTFREAPRFSYKILGYVDPETNVLEVR